MRVLTSACLLVLCFSVALASNPGEPLDCADWVFLAPGLSCTVLAPIGALGTTDVKSEAEAFLRRGSTAVVDNTGALYVVEMVNITSANRENDVGILQLERYSGGTVEIVAQIFDRDVTVVDHVRPTSDDFNAPPWIGGYGPPPLSNILSFDAVNGRILIPLRSYCTGGCDTSSYGGGWWIAAIEGFAPLLEIFQSYTPTSSAVRFTVPAHPEGLAAASFFDSFYGVLSTVGDWSQAQPMQCGYPSTPPSVGDYFEVADTLPTPPAGDGYYFVTAVHDMGERRYGRKRTDGTLTGRDPAVLPTCD